VVGKDEADMVDRVVKEKPASSTGCGFEDLDCYKVALKVLREAYRATSLLPAEEKYNLADQIRRAAVSIVLNIAEGYGRFHYLDSLRFYYIARGSISEVLSAFVICDELKYTSNEIATQREHCHIALRALNGYIRYVREQQQGKHEYGDRAVKEEPSSYLAEDISFGDP
jgi:four helix bundle protein